MFLNYIITESGLLVEIKGQSDQCVKDALILNSKLPEITISGKIMVRLQQ